MYVTRNTKVLINLIYSFHRGLTILMPLFLDKIHDKYCSFGYILFGNSKGSTVLENQLKVLQVQYSYMLRKEENNILIHYTTCYKRIQ